MFIDWITIKQHHCKSHKPFHGEIHATLSPDGKKLLKTNTKRVQYSGSDSTIITIHSDGHTVYVSGNIGRFNRPDNLFNYDLEQTIQKLNQIISQPNIGLPIFTKGETYVDSDLKIQTTGAWFPRLDLTENYAFGTFKQAQRYLTQLKNIKINRQKTQSYDTSMYWGLGSKKKTLKTYLKSIDLKRLKTKMIKKDMLQNINHLDNIIKYTHENGVLRFELQLKDQLTIQGLYHWSDSTHEKLTQYFEGEIMKLPKSCEHIDVNLLNSAQQITLLKYMTGQDIKSILARSTYYKHRKHFLENYSLDINQPLKKSELLNFMQFYMDVEFTPLQKPDWYELPEIKQA